MFDPRKYFKLSPADQAAHEDQYDGWFDRVETLVTEEFMCALVTELSPYHETGKLMELLRGELFPNTLLRKKMQGKFRDMWKEYDHETQDMYDFREDLKVAHVSGYIREEYTTDEETDANEMSDASIVQDAEIGDAENPQPPESAAVAPQASNKRAREDDDDAIEIVSKKLKTDAPLTTGDNPANKLDTTPDTTKPEIENCEPKPAQVIPKQPQLDTTVGSHFFAQAHVESHLPTPRSENSDSPAHEVLKGDFASSTEAKVQGGTPENPSNEDPAAAAEEEELTEATFLAIWNGLPASEEEGDEPPASTEEGDGLPASNEDSDESDEDEVAPKLPLPAHEPTPKRAREEDPEETAAKRRKLEQDAKWAALDGKHSPCQSPRPKTNVLSAKLNGVIESEKTKAIARKAELASTQQGRDYCAAWKTDQPAARPPPPTIAADDARAEGYGHRETALPDPSSCLVQNEEEPTDRSRVLTTDARDEDTGSPAEGATKKARKPVVCSRCHQPGHNKSNKKLCTMHADYVRGDGASRATQHGHIVTEGAAQSDADAPSSEDLAAADLSNKGISTTPSLFDTARADRMALGLKKGETALDRILKPTASGSNTQNQTSGIVAAATSDPLVSIRSSGYSRQEFAPVDGSTATPSPQPDPSSLDGQCRAAEVAYEEKDLAAQNARKQLERAQRDFESRHKAIKKDKPKAKDDDYLQQLEAKVSTLALEAAQARRLLTQLKYKKNLQDPEAKKAAQLQWDSSNFRAARMKREEQQRLRREAEAIKEAEEDMRRKEAAARAEAEAKRLREAEEQQKAQQRQRVLEEMQKAPPVDLTVDNEPVRANYTTASWASTPAASSFCIQVRDATGTVRIMRFPSRREAELWWMEQQRRQQQVRALQTQLRQQATPMPAYQTTRQQTGHMIGGPTYMNQMPSTTGYGRGTLPHASVFPEGADPGCANVQRMEGGSMPSRAIQHGVQLTPHGVTVQNMGMPAIPQQMREQYSSSFVPSAHGSYLWNGNHSGCSSAGTGYDPATWTQHPSHSRYGL